MHLEEHANWSATKKASHERILSAAAQAIRRSGFDGSGVAGIMNEAGLTHGGFYAHFASRNAMLAEATSRACADAAAILTEVAERSPPGQALAAMARAYFSQRDAAQAKLECPLVALGSEAPRQTAEVRRVITRHIQAAVDLVASHSADGDAPEARERALVSVATMVGTLLLARASDDAALSNDFCDAAMRHLASG